VAVLPFSDLSGSPGQDYLVDGMTDEVITLLARSTSLRVISRRSTMQYKNVQKPLAQIAADLKVDAVVEGSVMRSGRDVRITAQLLDAARDRHLWAQTYLDNSSEPLLNQDSVAADIARQVALTLTQKPLAISEQAIDPRAHELFLRARYLSNTRTLDALRRSIDYYKQAIQMDPKFAEAYAALGESYVVLSSYGGPDPPEMLQEARVAATRALAIKSDLGEAHTVLAAVKVDLDWDWTGAEAEFHRAIELNFGDATAHHWYGLHLARMRRFDEAQAELRTALSLDPLSVILETDVAEVAYYAHQPERAEKELLRALELDPHFADAHSVLGKVYEEKGDFPRALQEFRTASQLFGETPGSRALIAHALALSGRREEARKITRELEAERRRYISSVDIALVDCALKDNDRAMFWLEHGFQNRDKGMDVLGVEPLFDSCRADKRFQDLVKRLKL
jgi:TolB-like protein/Flp pilus assembly protein TadD